MVRFVAHATAGACDEVHRREHRPNVEGLTMQVTFMNFLVFLASDRAGGIWFAASGIVAACIAARFVPETRGHPASRWLKISGLGAMALGFLSIGLERLWYPLDSNGQGHLPQSSLQHSLAATALLSGVALILLGGVLWMVLGIQHGLTLSREIRPLSRVKHKKRKRLR